MSNVSPETYASAKDMPEASPIYELTELAEPGVPPCPSANNYRRQQNGQDDPIHHPSHYASGKFEVIDIIEDQLGGQGLRGFCLGNTLKYVCRAGKKDPKKTLEDLEKAEWYLHHYITRMKETKADNE